MQRDKSEDDASEIGKDWTTKGKSMICDVEKWRSERWRSELAGESEGRGSLVVRTQIKEKPKSQSLRSKHHQMKFEVNWQRW